MERNQHRLLTRLVALLLCFSLVLPQPAMAGWGMPKLPNPFKAAAKVAERAVNKVTRSSAVRSVTRKVCDTSPRACAVVRTASTAVKRAVQRVQSNFKPTQWVKTYRDKARAAAAKAVAKAAGIANRARNAGARKAQEARARAERRAREVRVMASAAGRATARKARESAARRAAAVRRGWDKSFTATKRGFNIAKELKWKLLTTGLSCISVVPGWGWAVGVANEFVIKPVISSHAKGKHGQVGNIYTDLTQGSRGKDPEGRSRVQVAQANAGNIMGGFKYGSNVGKKWSAKSADRAWDTYAAGNIWDRRSLESTQRVRVASQRMAGAAKWIGRGAGVAGAIECYNGVQGLRKDIRTVGREQDIASLDRRRKVVSTRGTVRSRTKAPARQPNPSVRPAPVPGG